MASHFSLRGWRQIAWLGVFALCLLCLLPPTDLQIQGPPLSDKAYHTLAYAILMWWFAMGYPSSQWSITAVGLVALGISLEFAQSFTADRVASVADEIANMCGIALGYSLACRTPTRFPEFRQAE
jgi:VanZ family protein